jgi:hypothetical protein
VVVAYEADVIDPVEHLGWSVVVTGTARLIRDPAEVARYQQVLTPWVARGMDQVIRIHSEIITAGSASTGSRPAAPPDSDSPRAGPSG